MQTVHSFVGNSVCVSASHLPWLMLMLLILSAQMASLVRVSITWSLCRTTSPCEETQADANEFSLWDFFFFF